MFKSEKELELDWRDNLRLVVLCGHEVCWDNTDWLALECVADLNTSGSGSSLLLRVLLGALEHILARP